jgi:hypothetical protein
MAWGRKGDPKADLVNSREAFLEGELEAAR